MLNSSNESTGILNPDTYLNHLSPAEGFEVQIRGDIAIVIFGAALWDAFTYLSTDTRIVRGSRFNFVILCFISSRVFALGHICFAAVNRAPTNNISPQALYIYSTCLCLLTMTTSSFLFLQRVLAIYYESKWVKRGFFILWTVASLSDIIVPLGGHTNIIPGTTKVKDSGMEPWVSLSVWFSLTFDTAVILAISYKMWVTHRLLAENQHVSWYRVLSGKTLPRLSRLILRGGLQYYLIIAGMATVTALVLSLSSVSEIYKPMFPSILVFLMSSMACRVFRNVKLFRSDAILTDIALS